VENSFTEENYLKAIYKLSKRKEGGVSTNALAERMDTKASSVTDMLKRLSGKKLVDYQKYQGVTLTGKGMRVAVDIIRKHRLWEVFLVEHLGFGEHEVHEVAEQMEHVSSPLLTERLDRFLNHPKYDPHGGPIPDADGNFPVPARVRLEDLPVGKISKVLGVTEHSDSFLAYMKKVGLDLGKEFTLIDRHDFDRSVELLLNGEPVHVSHEVARHIFVSN
jgi:DtxR family transcriptional regulator, Mn-dependent transcriptional regulator